MKIQKYGISYQFERSGQEPLDNSRLFNTYEEVRWWWETVGNFYITQIISIGNQLYYFYNLPDNPEEQLNVDINKHLIKIIDSSDFGSINFDTTELEQKFIDILFDTSTNLHDTIYNDLNILDTSFNMYVQNTDASIISILELLDGDTMERIEAMNMRIANVEAMLEGTNLEMISQIDSSIKDLYNTQWIQDISINRIDTSFQRIYNTYDVSYNQLKQKVDALNNNFESTNNGVGRLSSGEYAEIFNDYTNNIASGRYSHAEGYNNTATGIASHVTGRNNKSSGWVAFAAGEQNEAEGEYSVVFGGENVARGDYAFTVGQKNVASGKYAIALGNNVFTYNTNEIALGRLNYSYTAIGSNSYPILTLGVGVGDTAERNAMLILSDSSLYLYGVGNYTGTNPNNDRNSMSVNYLLNDLYAFKLETIDHLDSSFNATNSSIKEIYDYVISDNFLTDNYIDGSSNKTAFNQLGAFKLYQYILDTSNYVNNNLIDLTNLLNNEVENLHRHIFNVSTFATTIEDSLNSSVAIIDDSIGKLETSVYDITRYVNLFVDASIVSLKNHDMKLDASVNYNEFQIARLNSSVNKLDTSVRIIINDIYDISTNLMMSDTSINELEKLTRNMQYVKYTQQELTEKQKRQARENIDAAGNVDVSTMAEDINILLELQKHSVKHIFIDEADYNRLTSYEPAAVYYVVTAGTLTTIPKPSDKTIQYNGDPQAPVSNNQYTIIGTPGTEIGVYKFIAYLKPGYRWNDLTMDSIIITYTITGDEVETWEMGDAFPIKLA